VTANVSRRFFYFCFIVCTVCGVVWLALGIFVMIWSKRLDVRVFVPALIPLWGAHIMRGFWREEIEGAPAEPPPDDSIDDSDLWRNGFR
jgi:hypothetical protein